MPRCTPTSAALLALASVLAAEERPNPVVAFAGDTVSDFGAYFAAPVHWSGGEWAVAGGVGLAIGTSIVVYDQRVKEDIQDDRNPYRNRIGNTFNPLGTAFSVAYLGAAWGVSEVVGDPRGAWLARDGLESTLIATVITTTIKYGAGRSRPSDVESDQWEPRSGNRSFPSGHTTQAFALASVTARTFDDCPVVGVVAYTIASGVGLARINGNDHYLSDTMMGAAIGTTVGLFVVRRNRDRRAVEAGIEPVVAADRCGVVWRF